LSRGELYDAEWPGLGRRPAVIVTREVANPFLRNVVVALVTRTIRGLSTEVPLDEAQGLREDSVINWDNLLTVPKEALVRYRGSLGPIEMARLNDALRLALDSTEACSARKWRVRAIALLVPGAAFCAIL